MGRRRAGLIWDGQIYDFTELAKELKEDYEEDYPDKSDEWWEDFAREYNDNCLDDERRNLDIELDGKIVVIADPFGLWNGNVKGIKVLNTSNIKDIFCSFCNGEMKFYSDGYNIVADEIHHDGTNHYIYREVRDGVDIDNLIYKYKNGEEVTNKMINYYTKSIVKPVSDVYGW